MTIGELFVIESQQMQNRGVEIVHVDRVLDDLGGIIVGGSDDGAAA